MSSEASYITCISGPVHFLWICLKFNLSMELSELIIRVSVYAYMFAKNDFKKA